MKAAATLPPALSVQGLGKAYGERAVFHDLSFTLESGEVMAILGPSGSGKSTLLNCVAGLDSWDAGRVLLAETIWASSRTMAVPCCGGVRWVSCSRPSTSCRT